MSTEYSTAIEMIGYVLRMVQYGDISGATAININNTISALLTALKERDVEIKLLSESATTERSLELEAENERLHAENASAEERGYKRGKVEMCGYAPCDECIDNSMIKTTAIDSMISIGLAWDRYKAVAVNARKELLDMIITIKRYEKRMLELSEMFGVPVAELLGAELPEDGE